MKSLCDGGVEEMPWSEWGVVVKVKVKLFALCLLNSVVEQNGLALTVELGVSWLLG